MGLNVIGVSHRTAPVELREKLSFTLPDLERLLRQESGGNTLPEVTVLSTCNRTELYVASEKECESWCLEFLSRGAGAAGLNPYLYKKQERDAVLHLFNVSSGLDSLVLGEAEILKQVKDAYGLSQKLGLTGKLLNVLFQRALYVGKLVRTETRISQGAISVGSVAVSLAEKIFGNLSESAVLLFGAGKMAGVAAQYLLSKKVKNLFVANRTVATAESLAAKFHAQALSLESGIAHLKNVDVVITSLASTGPLITKSLIQNVMLKRANRSLFLIDIAVPRNVDPTVHEVDNVYLYNIDDLDHIVRENLSRRTQEIQKASRIVENKADEFFEWYRSLSSGEEKSLKHNTVEIAGEEP
ncbi:MAG: glutamyl-tRNA reductase [Elusimicrobia bacterium]|nr:glutamyl-tRNA reductase [Elusimicrobiota bacterium]